MIGLVALLLGTFLLSLLGGIIGVLAWIVLWIAFFALANES